MFGRFGSTTVAYVHENVLAHGVGATPHAERHGTTNLRSRVDSPTNTTATANGTFVLAGRARAEADGCDDGEEADPPELPPGRPVTTTHDVNTCANKLENQKSGNGVASQIRSRI